MILRVPSYYGSFRCAAGRCEDSCCIGWEIDIDYDTYTYYKNVGGAFGERLQTCMADGEEHSFRLRENGWCPFLNEDKLCDICLTLGEEALSVVCTEYPRFTLEYENVREKMLCLSCAEAARLVFSTDEKMTWVEQELMDAYDMDGDAGEASSEPFYDEPPADEENPFLAVRLEEIRSCAVKILQDRRKPVFVRAAEYLSYCEHMQRELAEAPDPAVRERHTKDRTTGGQDFHEWCGSEGEPDSYAAGAAYFDFLERLKRFGRLEPLNQEWTDEIRRLGTFYSQDNYLSCQKHFLAARQGREYEYEHLLVYFTFRYFMRAFYDCDILKKAQFAAAGVLMIRDMDAMRYFTGNRRFLVQDRINTARIFAKEVEHSEENMEMLADDFQFEAVFSPQRLKRQLLL